jgi:hypothetical protein
VGLAHPGAPPGAAAAPAARPPHPPGVLAIALRCSRTISASTAVTARVAIEFAVAGGGALCAAEELYLSAKGARGARGVAMIPRE